MLDYLDVGRKERRERADMVSTANLLLYGC